MDGLTKSYLEYLQYWISADAETDPIWQIEIKIMIFVSETSESNGQIFLPVFCTVLFTGKIARRDTDLLVSELSKFPVVPTLVTVTPKKM